MSDRTTFQSRLPLWGYGLAALVCFGALWLFWPERGPVFGEGRPKHVLVIGIDGLTNRALELGNTPNIDFLMHEGVHTLTMRAVLPTMSSPNWASHLMGAGPAAHGIDSNDWRAEDWAGQSFCGRGAGKGWPTILHLIKAQKPHARTAVFHDWVGISRFTPWGVTDRRRFRIWPRWVTRVATRHMRWRQPAFTFIQYDHVDKAGHAYGFDAWQYHRAVAEADDEVGRLLDTLEEAEMAETLVAVISDHGGIGRGHGGDTPEEVLVPWILWGAGLIDGPSTLANSPVAIAR
jgi:hypothetical protein